MRALSVHRPTASQADNWGPKLIVVGMALLLVSTWFPAPAVTGMALVALGATLATIARFKSAAALPVVSAANVFVYLSLYLLFVAAECHTVMTGPQDGLSFFQGLDFGASVGPMALVVRFSLRAIVGAGDAPAR